MYILPTSYIIIDSDTVESYNQIEKFYASNPKYPRTCTPSFNCDISKHYKLHYYFKTEDDAHLTMEKMGNFDIIHAGNNIAERLTTNLNFENIPTLTTEDYIELYTSLREISLKTNKPPTLQVLEDKENNKGDKQYYRP